MTHNQASRTYLTTIALISTAIAAAVATERHLTLRRLNHRVRHRETIAAAHGIALGAQMANDGYLTP